jgi:outer membrane protein
MMRFVLLAGLVAWSAEVAAQEKPKQEESQAVKPGLIMYANTDYIMSQLPDTKQLDSAIQAMRENYARDYQAKTQALQQQYDTYLINRESMSDTARASVEAQLQQGQADLQQFGENAQNTLQNTQKLYMAPIYLQVGKAMELVATEKGFSIILTMRVGDQQMFLYADQKRDATALILKKLGVEVPPPVKTPVAKNPAAKKTTPGSKKP